MAQTRGPGVPLMPLSMVRAGETVNVQRVRGTGDMRRHLQEIGFVDGASVHVVSSSGSNVIVAVKGSRFGLDARVARQVMTA